MRKEITTQNYNYSDMNTAVLYRVWTCVIWKLFNYFDYQSELNPTINNYLSVVFYRYLLMFVWLLFFGLYSVFSVPKCFENGSIPNVK